MISTDMLAAFVKVSETLSISKAGVALGTGKSAVSKRIAMLESVLGATLFSRHTRRVALTPAGEAYLDHARRALLELGAGEERVLAMRSDLSGRIRITAPVSWGQRILCRRLPEFLKAHPSIEVELVLSDRVMDLAFERMDVALRWGSVGDLAGLSVTPVAQVSWAMVASPQYLLSAGMPSSPEALERCACLFYWRDPADDWWTLVSGQGVVRTRVRSRYHVDNPEAVYEACVQGLGVAQLPDYLCAQDLDEGRLVRVLPSWTPQNRFGNQISAIVPAERWRILRNRVLVQFLGQDLGVGQAWT